MKIGFSDSSEIASNVMPPQEDGQFTAPQKFVLLKLGKNMFTIDDDNGEFDMDENSAQSIVDDFNKRGRDLVIDYDHATLDPTSAAEGNSPACGWVRQLEFDPKHGIVAVVKSWTPKAMERMRNKEYRYFSPVVNFDPAKAKSGKLAPIGVHSIGLTNHPALHKPEALIAAHDTQNTNQRVKAHQSIIKLCHDTILLNQEIMNSALNEYSQTVKGNKNLETEMRAFSDKAFATALDSAIAFNTNLDRNDSPKEIQSVSMADDNAATETSLESMTPESGEDTGDRSDKIDKLLSEIQNARASMPNDEFIKWLKQKQSEADDEALKRIIEAAINDASQNISEENTTENEGEQDMALMNDLGTILGISNPTIDSVTEEVKALCDIKTHTGKIASTLGLKKFNDSDFEAILIKRDLEKNKELLKENGELKKQLAMSDVSERVDGLIKAGKAVESQRKSLIDMAKKDIGVFNDYIKTLPPVFKDTAPFMKNKTTVPMQPLNDTDRKKQGLFSKEEEEAAKFLTGMSANELFGSK